MQQCSQSLPYVNGIMQMVIVLHDAVFDKMPYEEWTVPIRPRIQGIWNRRKYFVQQRPLYFLVICSSSSSIHGSTVPLASILSQVTTKAEAAEIIKDALVMKTAKILQMPASKVDPGRPLYRSAVDLLVALEVQNWITRERRANMALLEIRAAVPTENFTAKIVEKIKLLTV